MTTAGANAPADLHFKFSATSLLNNTVIGFAKLCSLR
jgi:hypothetical protein